MVTWNCLKYECLQWTVTTIVYSRYVKNWLNSLLYLVVSWTWWDWPLTILLKCYNTVGVLVGHLISEIVPKMTYNVSSWKLNPTIPYHTHIIHRNTKDNNNKIYNACIVGEYDRIWGGGSYQVGGWIMCNDGPYRVSTTSGNLLESEIPSGNLLEFNCCSWIFLNNRSMINDCYSVIRV